MGNDNEDLTLIENLSEFLHDDDDDTTDVNTKLDDFDFSSTNDISSIDSKNKLSSKEESDSFEESPPNFAEEEKSDAFEESSPSFAEEEESDAFEESSPSFAEKEESDTFEESPPSFAEEEESDAFEESPPSFAKEETDSFEKTAPQKTSNSPLTFSDNIGHVDCIDIETSTEAVRENFSDVKQFGENLTPEAGISVANPPFAIILKNIKYKDDAEDILRILRKHKVMDASNEKTYQNGIESGSVLISQLSEFAAITLAHQFRILDLEIQFGLVEELHNSKTYDSNSKGLVNKQIYKVDRSEELDLERSNIKLDSIIISTSQNLQNYDIIKYIDVISEHMVVDLSQYLSNRPLEELLKIEDNSLCNKYEKKIDGETSNKKLNAIYNKLLSNMREKAFKLKGNAIIDVNFQNRPISGDYQTDLPPLPSNKKNIFKISCIGNVVWVTDTN